MGHTQKKIAKMQGFENDFRNDSISQNIKKTN